MAENCTLICSIGCSRDDNFCCNSIFADSVSVKIVTRHALWILVDPNLDLKNVLGVYYLMKAFKSDFHASTVGYTHTPLPQSEQIDPIQISSCQWSRANYLDYQSVALWHA